MQGVTGQMTNRKVLLHVGYHKTGTTWLQNYLFNNEKYGFVSPMSTMDMMNIIALPNPLDFSLDTCRNEINQRLEQVESGNLTPVFSAERFSGHPHSGGYDSKEIADRLKALFPNARVLICIREQKKVILSCYNQYIKKGGAISVGAYLHVLDRTRVPLFDFRHFMYHRLIRYYQTVFGKENILVLPYELFARNSKEYVSQIIEFAAGQSFQDSLDDLPMRRMTNSSITGFELVMRRFLNFTIGMRNSINQFSIRPLNKKYNDFFFGIVQKMRPIVPAFVNKSIMRRIENKISEMAGERFCESNRITSELIGIDLSQFGYRM